ncbi:hypothetical protein [Burkholderia ambifaria]|uniref:hypothetical protein n=1 Tax=Burkholderia ambifaria TaxID=152480 RepID=UPI001588A83E
MLSDSRVVSGNPIGMRNTEYFSLSNRRARKDCRKASANGRFQICRGDSDEFGKNGKKYRIIGQRNDACHR